MGAIADPGRCGHRAARRSTRADPAGATPVTLSARALALGYGHHTVLRELSVDIAPGQCWAVLGNNGSGKTTLLHTLAGIRAPLAGTVALDQRSLAKLNAGARARAIGLLLQDEPLEFWG